MARQQAFSSWLIAAPVMQARTGAAALSSRNKATTLARRRITAPIYADRQIPLAVQTYSPANSCFCLCCCRCLFFLVQRNRHFDRRCSRFCEHRSGETRFSTHTTSQPGTAFAFAVVSFTSSF